MSTSLNCWQYKTARFQVSAFKESNKGNSWAIIMCKNIYTNFNVLCFTPALSKINNDCSDNDIIMDIKKSKQIIFFPQPSWQLAALWFDSVKLGRSYPLNLHFAVSWRRTWYWGKNKNWIHFNSSLCVRVCVRVSVCVCVRAHSLGKF